MWGGGVEVCWGCRKDPETMLVKQDRSWNYEGGGGHIFVEVFWGGAKNLRTVCVCVCWGGGGGQFMCMC